MQSIPSPNFAFPAYDAALGTQSGQDFATDPNGTLYKLRQFCGRMNNVSDRELEALLTELAGEVSKDGG